MSALMLHCKYWIPTKSPSPHIRAATWMRLEEWDNLDMVVLTYRCHSNCETCTQHLNTQAEVPTPVEFLAGRILAKTLIPNLTISDLVWLRETGLSRTLEDSRSRDTGSEHNFLRAHVAVSSPGIDNRKRHLVPRLIATKIATCDCVGCSSSSRPT